ncbi:MAG: hypothetical protein ACTS73_01690 [Arsenophonus sp. NEOnobi-MAG3]
MLPSFHKCMQAKVKGKLQWRKGKVWLAESRDTANNAIDILLARFSAKYHICSDEEAREKSRRLLKFYHFLLDH